MLPAALKAQFTYTTNNGAITITSYNGPGGAVTIPDTINGYPVVSIGTNAFQSSTVTSIAIPDNVTNIGDQAFWYCYRLTAITVDAQHSVYSSVDGVLFDKSQTTLIQYPGGNAGSYAIPDSVTNIGNGAFAVCSTLTNVIIPGSVTSIEDYAFYDCFSLTGMTIGNGVTSIGNYAFSDCYDLTDITISNRVTSIGDLAFSFCRSLTNVVIANNVTNIGNFAFYYCVGLTSATIPDGVTSIGNNAFSQATSLTNVTIGNGVTSIAPGTFSDCYALTDITIGNRVTSIGDDAFYACRSLASVTIPDSVTSLSGFWDCFSLTNVAIGNGVTNIGNDAFAVCTNLSRITIPSSVISIGPYAFAGCGLINVTIPENVTSLGSDAFEGCTGLTNVIIGSGITDIASYTFASCSNLTSILIGSNVISIDTDAFESCGLTDIIIPNNVTSIGYQVFYECVGLTDVSIGSGVTNIGSSAFEDCSNLAAITVDDANSFYSSADGVLYDKNQANLIQFPNGRGGSYTIPNSVTSIGNAFNNCTHLTSVTIGSGVTNIVSYAFESCSSLTAITVDPANLFYRSVDGVLFDKNQGTLIAYPAGKGGSYIVPDNVTSIGAIAFGNCSGLTHVTIPNSVTNIGDLAFYYCTSLTALYFQGNAPRILPGFLSRTFTGDSKLTIYYLPGTTGWSSTFGGRPAVLWNPQATTFSVTGAQFGFNLAGPTNAVIVVEACTNLVNPVWLQVSTNTLTGGTSSFSDSQSSNYPGRFYRFRSP